MIGRGPAHQSLDLGFVKRARCVGRAALDVRALDVQVLGVQVLGMQVLGVQVLGGRLRSSAYGPWSRSSVLSPRSRSSVFGPRSSVLGPQSSVSALGPRYSVLGIRSRSSVSVLGPRSSVLGPQLLSITARVAAPTTLHGGAALRPSAHDLVPNAAEVGRRARGPRRRLLKRSCESVRAFVTGPGADRSRRAESSRG